MNNFVLLRELAVGSAVEHKPHDPLLWGVRILPGAGLSFTFYFLLYFVSFVKTLEKSVHLYPGREKAIYEIVA